MDSILIHGFRIGEWQVWPEEGRIAGPDGPQHIEPKVMDVLVCLANRAGRVVPRETLLAEVWEGRAVSDEPLSRCIAELRRHLGDSRGQSRYIETIPKRGYKLVGSVSASDDSFQRNAGAPVDYPSTAHDISGWPADASTGFAGLEIIRWLGEGTMAKVFLARKCSGPPGCGQGAETGTLIRPIGTRAVRARGKNSRANLPPQCHDDLQSR